MYSEPVVLKPSVLFQEKYEHFLCLHVALRLLASEGLNYRLEDIDFAEKLLTFYVPRFGQLYGAHHLVYDMHSLTHLAKECRVHGPLPEFSAYAFESRLQAMGKLKNIVNRSVRDK